MESENSRHSSVRVRPNSATVISWFWILTGLATFLSGVESFFKLRKFRSVRPEAVDDTDAKALLDGLEALIGGTLLEMLVVTFCSITCIAGAVGLLKLRPWGRATLIALSWVSLASVAVGTPILVWAIASMASPAGGVSVFEVIFWFFGFLNWVFGVAIFAKMLLCLHGSKIRDAVSN